MREKKSRGKNAGVKMARAIVEFIHLMYQKNTALRVLDGLIGELTKQRRGFENDKRPSN